MPDSHSNNDGKSSSCRACSDETDMFASMRKTLYNESHKKKSKKLKHQEEKEISSSDWPKLPCPPDNTRLGRATWTFLHSVAAYYPNKPSEQHKLHAKSLLSSLPSLYPCETCANHLGEYYKKNPYDNEISTRESFSLYLCKVHNEVRNRQGKREFDCSKIFDRWGGHDWKPNDECDEEREFGDVEDLAANGE